MRQAFNLIFYSLQAFRNACYKLLLGIPQSPAADKESGST